MKGGEDIFVENLPGFPDNIRLSSTGGYWVAMSAIRPNPGFSMMDFLSDKPWIKRIILKVKKKKPSSYSVLSPSVLCYNELRIL